MAGVVGFEPTNEGFKGLLAPHLFIETKFTLIIVTWLPGLDSNQRVGASKAPALPLGYRATTKLR